jgi:histidyl-tRNA synthetase
MQIGNVWRADRPQKGRYRQFTQCDIDILGDPTKTAEITLISSTAGVLRKLGFDNFTIRINDRRLLRLCADSCNIPAEEHDKVFIILDKMDKIGIDGVRAEMLQEGYSEEIVEKYTSLYDIDGDIDINAFVATLGEAGAAIAADISTIMRCASAATVGGCKLKFDPTLVRGMSYYTGTIFEIQMDGYGYSVGGGGRYDEMLGKFTGQKVPACGFSLGFERIVSALIDSGFVPPVAERSIAFLASRNMSEEAMVEMYARASALRAEGARVLVTTKMKNVYFQKTKLEEEGYFEFIEM